MYKVYRIKFSSILPSFPLLIQPSVIFSLIPNICLHASHDKTFSFSASFYSFYFFFFSFFLFFHFVFAAEAKLRHAMHEGSANGQGRTVAEARQQKCMRRARGLQQRMQQQEKQQQQREEKEEVEEEREEEQEQKLPFRYLLLALFCVPVCMDTLQLERLHMHRCRKRQLTGG